MRGRNARETHASQEEHFCVSTVPRFVALMQQSQRLPGLPAQGTSALPAGNSRGRVPQYPGATAYYPSGCRTGGMGL
jgi:hypothetical protein